MKEPKTLAGKLLRKVVAFATTATPQGKIAQLFAGVIQGTVETLPISTLKDFFDVNQDGKVDFKDVKEMSLKDVVKVVTVGGLTALLIHYGIVAL